jgi:hypothetical protein
MYYGACDFAYVHTENNPPTDISLFGENIYLLVENCNQGVAADPGSGQWTDDGQTMSVGRLPARTTPGTPMTNGNSPTGPTDIPQITQTFTLNKLIYY